MKPNHSTLRASAPPREPRLPSDATALMTALVMFCFSEGGRCFELWPELTLWNYLNFHARQKTLVWVQAHGRICACATTWQCDFSDILTAMRERGHVFTWQPTNPQGDTLFIGDIVAHGESAIQSVCLGLARRWPDWQRYHLFTIRRGRIHRLEPETLLRLALGEGGRTLNRSKPRQQSSNSGPSLLSPLPPVKSGQEKATL